METGSQDGRLGERGVRVHLVRDAVLAYREHAGGEADAIAPVLHRLAHDAIPVARELVPEVWSVEDDAEGLSLTLRVLRWERHAVVLGVAVQPIGAPRIRDAVPVARVVEEHQRRRGGISEGRARAELRAATWDARAVDVEVQPEQWRMRSRLTMDDWTLRVTRTGHGPPLIVSATWRSDSRRG